MSQITVLTDDLKPGDKFTRHVYRRDGKGMGVRVEVLTHPEPGLDKFSRGELKVWCRRDDDGSEGWVPFGYNTYIRVEA